VIRMYYGLQGQGKTYSMVADTLAEFKETPCQVYTNMGELRCPEARYFYSIEEIIDLSEGKILLDEAAIVMPAQFWHDMGRELLVRLCQMRKRGLDLYYSNQRQTGANVNLREQTNEVIHCSKVGPWFINRKENPDKKVVSGGRWRRFRASIASMYDTFEAIAGSGGSEGRPEQPLSLAVRRRREQRKRPAGRTRLRPLLAYAWHEGWWGACSLLRPSKDAAAVLAWLKSGGHYDSSRPWSVQVRAELKRQAWLKEWGLSPDDAPFECRPESPWMVGYDPVTVKAVWDERQQSIEEEKLAIKAVTRRGARKDAV